MTTTKRVRVPRWVLEWLLDWPAGTQRELGNYVQIGSYPRRVSPKQLCTLGYLIDRDHDGPEVPGNKQTARFMGRARTFERTDKRIRLRQCRTANPGPCPTWPWPIPHHVTLVHNSSFANHVQWVESLGQTLDEAIYRPQRVLRYSSKTRVRIVRAWLTKPELAYIPTWLEKFSSPVHVAIWCAILLVRPVARTDKGWRFAPVDPEEAKQRLLSLSHGTVDDALQQLSER